jgi:hypothetical protein
MKSTNAVVRGVLARHLNREVSSIYSWQHLERDLDLTPLELVLVALEVEELESVPIPVEELAATQTVGDLLSFFSLTVAREKRRSVLDRVA